MSLNSIPCSTIEFLSSRDLFKGMYGPGVKRTPRHSIDGLLFLHKIQSNFFQYVALAEVPIDNGG